MILFADDSDEEETDDSDEEETDDSDEEETDDSDKEETECVNQEETECVNQEEREYKDSSDEQSVTNHEGGELKAKNEKPNQSVAFSETVLVFRELWSILEEDKLVVSMVCM